MNSKIKNRAVKCFERIITLANQGKPITFSKDFGTPALTVSIDRKHHHSYLIVTNTEEFINWFYTSIQEKD